MNIFLRDLTRMKKTLSHRADSEHEQTLIRIGIAALMLMWFLLAPYTGLVEGGNRNQEMTLLAVSLYFAVAGMSFLNVLKHPEVSVKRRIFWIVVDPLIFGLLFSAAGNLAIPLLFVFIWVPIDNGFRYGSKYLFASLALCMSIVIGIVSLEQYWSTHQVLGAAMLLEIGFLCAYTSIPIRRLNEANDRLAMMATRDPLTNLANRHLFIEHLQNAMALTERNERYCACVFIDLDGFKKVNDTHGHAIGDLLLIEVSRQIKASLRDTDLVARLGGDEFAVAAQCFQVPVDAVMVSGRILKALTTIKDIDGCTVSISGSIGVSWYQFSEGNEMSVDTLIDNADIAMYAAKNAGKNCIRVVGPNGDVTDPEALKKTIAQSSAGDEK
jgi:diguanylate cyclase (GGDEF)-like protein